MKQQELAKHAGRCGCCGHRDASPERRLQRILAQIHPQETSGRQVAAGSGDEYSAAVAAEYVAKYGPQWGEDLALRTYTSHLIGSRRDLVLHGGGNTSVKILIRDGLGEKREVLAVKGSGYSLDSIIPKGFPQVDMGHLRKPLNAMPDGMTDIQMVNELRTNLMDASSPNPSVESLLHALIPAKFVDHSHADAIVTLADLEPQAAKAAFREAFRGSGLRPGLWTMRCQALRSRLARQALSQKC